MSANPLHRLKIRTRMLVIMLVFMVPIIVLSYKYDKKMAENIQFTNMEIKGSTYTRALIGIINQVGDYQLALLRTHLGEAGAEKDVVQNITEIDNLMAQLQKADELYGEELSVSKEGFAKQGTKGLTAAEIIKAWQDIKNQSSYKPEAFGQLTSNIIDTINHIGETSGILLDIDLDSYYLMDATFAALPQMLSGMAEANTDIYSVLNANGGTLPGEHRALPATSVKLLHDIYYARTRDDIANSLRNDAAFHDISPTLKPNIDPKFAAFSASKNKLAQALTDLADGRSMPAITFADISRDMNDNAAALSTTAFNEMVKLFELRLVDLKHQRYTSLATTLLSIVLAYILFFFVSRSVSAPVRRVQETLTSIAEGDTDMEIPTSNGNDEISQLYVATEKLRETVEDAFRLKQMVEDMPTNLLTIDARNGFKVNYANKAIIKTLKGLESDLGVTQATLIGSPSDKVKIASQLLGKVSNLPHHDKIKVGKELIDVNVAAIRDKKGEYIGAMVTWNLVTRQAELANNFESSVKSVVTEVSASAGQMRGNAERLSTLADDTKQRSALVSTAATEAAQTANQVAAAAEELTAAIAEISAQVQKASSVSSQASTQAANINESMHMLVDKSNRVGEVIQFITNIASQINLLALNATIESARAGEAGRGFAVVASEVKNLANQTAKATEEIVQQVQSMQEATHQAVDSVTQIINIINEISASTAGVAAAVEEQSAATNEISRNIAHTAAGTNEISQNIGAVEHGADETGVSSREVLKAATALSGQASTLSQKVDEFLVMVRE